MPQSLTESDMIELLDQRYRSVRPGTNADRYVRAAHVRSAQGAYGAVDGSRIADYIAIDKWNSSQAIHGHEIKVSRSDWLTELRDPTKASAWSAKTNTWWLVVPDDGIVAEDELPEGWGLMTRYKTGSKAGLLRIRRKATFYDRGPVDLDTLASIADAAAIKRAREIASWSPAPDCLGYSTTPSGGVVLDSAAKPWELLKSAATLHDEYHALHKLPAIRHRGRACQHCPETMPWQPHR